MFLAKRDPSTSMPTLQNIQSAMNRLFEDAFDDAFSTARTRTSSWAPPVEIFERENELIVMAELPGFSKEDVTIAFENGQLTFSGERVQSEEEGRHYHRNERWYGRFERTFQFPASVDPEKITAKLRDGLLTISVAKKEEAKARQIEVDVG